MLSVKGKILVVSDITERGEKKFKTAEFVLETDEKYPQKVKFELLGDNTKLASDLQKAISGEVFFNVKGKEWNGKFYNSLECYKFVADKLPF
jgi:single-strand DNA-binding protein